MVASLSSSLAFGDFLSRTDDLRHVSGSTRRHRAVLPAARPRPATDSPTIWDAEVPLPELP